MDQFLQEQHTYTLARNAQVSGDVADEQASWVMLNRDGGIEPLPNERILHEVPGRVKCDISSKEFTQDSSTPFSVTSDSGKAYVTNQRVIFLAGRPTADFKSFSARIIDVRDSRVESTFFAGWRWSAAVKPVAGGGIPAGAVLVRVHFTFREGGHNDFFQTFTLIKERLHHAREMGVDTRRHNIDIEPPPVYSAGAGAGAAAGAAAAGPSSSSSQTQSQEPPALQPQPQARPPPPPNEPPPDYEEAQAEAVRTTVEEQFRAEADRG